MKQKVIAKETLKDTDYFQFMAFATERGCKAQGTIGRLPKYPTVRVESWELPEGSGFILMVNEVDYTIGIYEFVGKNGDPVIHDIEWLHGKTSQ